MIITNNKLFHQDGTTFEPKFFLSINISESNVVNININNIEGTNLTFNWFPMEHTKEVKEFIEYISKIAIEKLEEKYPTLTDLNIKV